MNEEEVKDIIELKLKLIGVESCKNLIGYFMRKQNFYLLEKEIFTCYCSKYQFPHQPIIDSYVEGEVVIESDDGLKVDIDLEIPFNLEIIVPLDTYIAILEEIRKFIDIQYQIDHTSQDIEINYKEGKRHGKCKFYNSRSNHIQSGEYDNGIPIGIWKTYYPSGRLFKENDFSEKGIRKFLETKWFEDGQKKQDWIILADSGEIQIRMYNEEGNILNQSIHTKEGRIKSKR